MNLDFAKFWAQSATAASQPPAISFAPGKLQELQQQYFKEAAGLWESGSLGAAQSKDKRFAGKAWDTNPVAAFAAAAYLLNARTLIAMADALQTDAKTRARI